MMTNKIVSVKMSKEQILDIYRKIDYKNFWHFFDKIILVEDQPRIRQITSKWTSQKMREFRRWYYSELKEVGYFKLIKIMEDFNND